MATYNTFIQSSGCPHNAIEHLPSSTKNYSSNLSWNEKPIHESAAQEGNFQQSEGNKKLPKKLADTSQ